MQRSIIKNKIVWSAVGLHSACRKLGANDRSYYFSSVWKGNSVVKVSSLAAEHFLLQIDYHILKDKIAGSSNFALT